ncbi:MAG: sugar transferase [Prosthecobacter sp.]|uniref:sugar transferase n=1 Tax=Prosthecobacter sp. TaxID=1965333 RepID=UPI0038FF3F88
MKALIICPDHRHAAAFARRRQPLALLPVLGRTLLDLWLEHLATTGEKHVTILAADRPEEIRHAIEQGDQHGLAISVIPVKQEPAADAARAQFITGDQAAWHPLIITLDTLPNSPSQPLWAGGATLFDTLLRQLRDVDDDTRLTMREIAPAVHVSTRARIAMTARIDGPAWIGPDVVVADHAQILAGSIIESAACIDHHACVSGSWIGPDTYVGAMTEVSHSFAWGKGLDNWLTGSQVEITDEFLLSSLQPQSGAEVRCGWLTRLFALLLMLITAPLALLCAAWSCLKGSSIFSSRQVVRLPAPDDDYFDSTITLHALNHAPGLFARWPELWHVVCGALHLVGNRPLCPVRATLLKDEFERLWLHAPAGVFTLADVMHDDIDDSESAFAHSASYAMKPSLRLDLRILLHCLPRFLMLRPATASAVSFSIMPQHTPHPCS